MTMKWRPHSSDEACDFEFAFCSRCACDSEDLDEADGCPIAAQGFGVSIGLEGPQQWVQDGNGPRCTAFLERVAGEPRKDPFAVERALAAYNALPRDSVTGRPVIA